MARKTRVLAQAKAESITVRLDPKTRYGLELLARKQRRTISSVVEWALQKAIYDPVDGLYDEKSETTNFLDFLWDVEESDRLYHLATCRPQLLTFEEEKLIKVVIESEYFQYLSHQHKHLFNAKKPNLAQLYQQKMREGIREHFETYKKVALGESSKDMLPKPPRNWKPSKSKKQVAAEN